MHTILMFLVVAAKLDAVPGGAGLQLKVVKYDGSVNGAITIEVQNPTASDQTFDARGLFFVPVGDPDHAPQRLGAVGPFRIGDERRDTLKLAPGEHARVSLDVYCIDSHRPAPDETTPFRVAKTRIPPALTQAITTSAENASKQYGGISAAPAKAAVQGEVWRNRDAKWLKLDGEGQQEANK